VPPTGATERRRPSGARPRTGVQPTAHPRLPRGGLRGRPGPIRRTRACGRSRPHAVGRHLRPDGVPTDGCLRCQLACAARSPRDPADIVPLWPPMTVSQWPSPSRCSGGDWSTCVVRWRPPSDRSRTGTRSYVESTTYRHRHRSWPRNSTSSPLLNPPP